MPRFFPNFFSRLLKPLFVRRRAHTHDPAHPKLKRRYNKKAGCASGGNTQKIDMTWIEFSTSRSAWGGAEQLGQVRAPAGKQFPAPACSRCFCMKLMCRAEWEVKKHTCGDWVRRKACVCMRVSECELGWHSHSAARSTPGAASAFTFYPTETLPASRAHTPLFFRHHRAAFLVSHFSCCQAHLGERVCLLGGVHKFVFLCPILEIGIIVKGFNVFQQGYAILIWKWLIDSK